MRLYRFLVVVASSLGLGACTALFGIDSLRNVDCVGSACADASLLDARVSESGTGDPVADGEVRDQVGSDDSPPDHAGDAGAVEAGTPVPAFDPRVILSAFGDVAAQTGQAQERHLVYGASTARFYLFYLDAAVPDQLAVRSSPDLTTWRDEPAQALSLPHGSEGRSFSVATAVLGGVDVFHVLLSLFRTAPNAHRTYHARARALPGAALTWTGISLLTDLNVEFGQDVDSTCDLDGPDVAITPDGWVLDFTGWETWDTTMCDGDVFAAANRDDGGPTWTPAFPSGQDRSHIFYLPVAMTSNAHSLTALPSGDVVALFSNGHQASTDGPWPDDVGWSRSRDAGYTPDASGVDAEAVSWPQMRNVFPVPTNQSVNDWTSCAMADGTLHSVRRAEATTDTFEHLRYDGAAWTSAGGIPPAAGFDGSGLALVRSGDKMLLFAIAKDGSSLQSLAWNGSSWAPAWRTVIAAGPPRAWLTSAGCAAMPTIAWTEGASGAYTVVGTRVDALFE